MSSLHSGLSLVAPVTREGKKVHVRGWRVAGPHAPNNKNPSCAHITQATTENVPCCVFGTQLTRCLFFLDGCDQCALRVCAGAHWSGTRIPAARKKREASSIWALRVFSPTSAGASLYTHAHAGSATTTRSNKKLFFF
nr:hypothetical protein [Pandoravirus massiliensis]